MNDAFTTPEATEVPLGSPLLHPPTLASRSADTPEEKLDVVDLTTLRVQLERYRAMAGRRADLVEALGDLFDSLRPTLNEALPGWWEEHDPLALIREEFEGWEPGRILEVRQREGLYLRGRSTPEQRADLRRRTAGLRENPEQP